MPFNVGTTNNNQTEAEVADQAAEVHDVVIPEPEATAIEEASPTFELTSLPARTGGARGGRRGLRNVTDAMGDAVVQSEDPDAAIEIKGKAITPQMKAWAAERTLKFVTRGGKIYLTKAPAEEAPEV